MALQNTVTSQTDFSAGEVDATVKRDEASPLFKKGLRQCANFRILNTNKLTNRMGRSAKYKSGNRVDEVLMSPGNVFKLDFSAATLTVRTLAGASLFTTSLLGDGATAVPWTATNVNQIDWVVFQKSIYLTFPGMQPQIVTWDGVSTWAIQSYTTTFFGNQERAPFYRIAPQGITLQPSSTVGTVNITFAGGNVLVAGMVGTRLRYAGRQLTIASVTNGLTGTATVNEPLPPSQTLTISSTVGTFSVGDVIEGATSNAKGILTNVPSTQTVSGFAEFAVPAGAYLVGDAVSGATSGATGTVTSVAFYNGVGGDGIQSLIIALTSGTFIVGEVLNGGHGHGPITIPAVTTPGYVVQLLQSSASIVNVFTTETVVGPSASGTISGVSTGSPQPITVWDQEVMNAYQGWPASVFSDQGRLGFCNFPSVPAGIAWSALGVATDLYPFDASSPTNAIFELAPGNGKVLYVIPGAESSEFVFMDNAIWYIPITTANPLKPGAVGFNLLSSEGGSSVKPQRVQESIVYLPSGASSVRAIVTTGAYYRPHDVRRVSSGHDHLFNSPVAIAAAGATDPNFPEIYVYVLNGNGTLAVAKLLIENGQITADPGWMAWSGVGTVKWVSSRLGTPDIWYATTYPTGPVTIAELSDATQYLDAAISVNSVPSGLPPPGGKGPLWWYAGGTVTLMDLGTRQMGTYSIDANGNIIPQFQGGENLSSAQLVAGQAWTATAEPFIPAPGPGQDVKQRMVKRKVARMEVSVKDSTGFEMAKLFSGPLRNGGPALGTVMNIRRVTTYNQDDDATQAPPLREESQFWRPAGRAYDPRIAVIKDTAGPLTLLEIGAEVTV